ncbi:2,3-bisphosphoglycerate-independent phosphoglycerate mutase [Nymphon striatum]|nr:2,3-bisphosphoglycerate-independent phosphoglycerate mutase [Nymphon striatum]
MLVIMDGFGVNPSKKNNAVYEANTPNLDEYFGKYPHTTLEASGKAVGLPDGQMGNSEVGHLTIGCGIIIKQNLVRVDDAIEDGSLAQNQVLLDTIAAAKAQNRPLHLIGLVSDGGVHSHVNHLCALIKICNENQVKPVIHAITDGRDTSPKSSKKYLQQMVDTLEEFGGSVATVSGRYYAMDRDNRWDRTQIAWEAMVNGKGETATDVLQAIDDAYANGENDEFKLVILYCFSISEMTDPRQMTAALSMPDFNEFDRGSFSPVVVTTMTEYEKKFNAPIIFPPERPATNLADTISQAGLKQLHCSETEKYAHVTFFLNGGKEQPYENEDRILIESPKVNTYDECPEMSAKEVADEIVKAAEAGEHDFIVVNFANGDMVGHTAVPEPIIKAVETLDREVGRVLDAAVANDYSVLLTADHGNCDEYIDPFLR